MDDLGKFSPLFLGLPPCFHAGSSWWKFRAICRDFWSSGSSIGLYWHQNELYACEAFSEQICVFKKIVGLTDCFGKNGFVALSHEKKIKIHLRKKRQHICLGKQPNGWKKISPQTDFIRLSHRPLRTYEISGFSIHGPLETNKRRGFSGGWFSTGSWNIPIPKAPRSFGKIIGLREGWNDFSAPSRWPFWVAELTRFPWWIHGIGIAYLPTWKHWKP